MVFSLRAARQSELKEVGAALQFKLAEADYQPEVHIQMPQTLESQALTLTPRSNAGQYLVDAGPGSVSGVWQFGLLPRNAPPEHRYLAVNVAAGEGDLHHLDRAQLAKRLEGIDYEFSLASQMRSAETSFAGYRLHDTLLTFLLAALLVEQWLATKASYHTQPLRTAT